MDNQHQKIKGYRDLTQGEIDLMNEGKELEAKVMDYCERVKKSPLTNQRSLAIGISHFQTSFMWIIRAIARPNGE